MYFKTWISSVESELREKEISLVVDRKGITDVNAHSVVTS
jgi:hypothetical protein